MTGQRCAKCRTWWTHQATTPERFVFISVFCPLCIAATMRGAAT